jgi:spore maturation protein CgeB
MKIVILGLSITSSWGNGHATTFRSLVRGLSGRGHEVIFLERDTCWHAQNRDQAQPRGAMTHIYQSVGELQACYEQAVYEADLVITGSQVPDGIAVGNWVNTIARGATAFYDIDTPVTLEHLAAGRCEYLDLTLVRRYDLYLSFTGGPILQRIEREFGSPMARALYCSADTGLYRPHHRTVRWDLGYLGTWSEDRQPALDALLLQAAHKWPEGRFVVGGPLYPETIVWPDNVERTIHLSPQQHPAFYGSQRFTLHVTRPAMRSAGHSPSVRLFEAGACGIPIISDYWPGLESIFEPEREVLISESPEDTLRYLHDISPTSARRIGEAARKRVLRRHSPMNRAEQIEQYVSEVRRRRRSAHAHGVSG